MPSGPRSPRSRPLRAGVGAGDRRAIGGPERAQRAAFGGTLTALHGDPQIPSSPVTARTELATVGWETGNLGIWDEA